VSSASAVRSAVVAAVVAAAVFGAAGTARADGDPASDVLYDGRVFFSYNSISKPAQAALTRTVQRAERAGYPIRVALIAAPDDLGAVTSLWGKPRRYARFLDLELSFVYKGPLLVVMPQGLGFAHYRRSTTQEERELARVRPQGGRDGLARTAIDAVALLARRAGHPVTPATVGAGSSGDTLALVLGVVGAALVVAAVVVVALRRRRGGRPDAT
jgi:hypothetical protein